MSDERTVVTDLRSGEGPEPLNTLATQGRAAAQPSEPPQIIGGYRRIRVLGSGGMGDVYLAEQVQLGRQVALKLLRPGADAGFAQRFLREAKTMASVTHPHVVAIHDAGEADGFLFMALELVTGGDLNRLLKTRGRLDEAEALRLLVACCRGLEAIETAGLIHRDIKPANIFLTRDGVPKIGDLGLARHADGEDRMTLTGHSWGTPAYMSPEQVRGEPDIDIRSDIYALGATLFCLLTGHPPFQGGTSYVITNAVLTVPAPDVRQANRTVSAATAAIIRTALGKDRRQRHPTAAALRVDLERALAGLPLAYAAVTDAPAAPEVTRSSATATTAPTLVDTGGLSWHLDPSLVRLLAYGAGAGVLGLVLWSLSGETHVERPTKPSTPEASTPATPRPPVSSTWMSLEGVDDLGPWAEIRPAGVPMRLRRLPAGTFTLGSPTDEHGRHPSETRREVTLTSPLWMAEAEIDHAAWSSVMGTGTATSRLPVTGVNWYEVNDFLRRLQELGIPARLPTEAEWEVAVRAGSAAAYPGGERPDPRDWLGQPAEAGPRLPDPASVNRLGLLEMPGNVREWVADAWDGQRPLAATPVTDPCENFGGRQVVRGGAWDTPPTLARSAARAAVDPQTRDPRIGFRIVITP